MKRSRRKRQRPAPELGWEAEIPPSRLETEVARIMQEDAAKRVLVSELPSVADIHEDIIASMALGGDDGPKPRLGYATFWIDAVCPNDTWQGMTAKAVEQAIWAAIDEHNKNTAGPRINKKPSYSAIRQDIKRRKNQSAKT